jgi:predicted ATPase/DNA-binding CsgD family transcriptional regulator/transcriptional regulator with XRE-family HTH domain
MDEFHEHPYVQPWSSRELEIVRLLADGLTNREIADKLFLSPETVKWYNKQIFDKLGVNSRTQAAARAREMGLLDGEQTAKSATVPFTPSKLPAQLTSFVGRQRELAEVRELLQTTRLVTLTGPGGTGKTRLSLQVAAAVTDHYAHGVTFVGLASTADPEQVPAAIAREIGLLEQPGQSLPELLARYFENKHALLVLDNYEHVLEAAPLVSDLLAAAPRLSTLATSREVLRLSGEHEYPVPPLTVPDPAHLDALTDLADYESVATYESVALFLQRAQAAKPDFALTAENTPAVAAICARLDGLPLAIELATARLRLFDPEQLLARLERRLEVLKGGPRDLPARQRTLRDTIDWSYRLLEQDEQRLFWRLGVFVGGRTIEAVETICAPGLTIDPLDGLESLLHKSLIYQEEGPGGEPRFVMLETIHEYAHERLNVSGEARLMRDRHLQYFLELAEEMAAGYRRQGQLRLLANTVAEKGNLSAAFDWAIETKQIEAAARLISSLSYFWYYYDSPVEGFRWYRRVLPGINAVSEAFRPALLLGAGQLATVNGDPVQGRQFYRSALVLARELGDLRSEAWSLMLIAVDPSHKETFSAKWRRTEQALAIFQASDDKPSQAQAFNIQGELTKMAGDNKLAREKYLASLAMSRETGETLRQIMVQANLSMIAYNEGEYREARDLAQSALERFYESGIRQGTISALWNLAGPLSRLGQPAKAARLVGASAALFEEMGAADHPSDFEQLAKYSAAARAQLGEVDFQTAWRQGQAMTLEQAVACALAD